MSSRNQRRHAAKLSRKMRRPASSTSAAGAGRPEDLAVIELLSAGANFQRQGKLTEAEAEYRRAHLADPRNVDALFLLGYLAYAGGDFDRALELIERALAEQDKNPSLHNLRGSILTKQNRYDSAIKAHGRALQIDPGNFDAHFNLGCALSESGAPETAIAEYRKAIALQPEYADAHYNLANALRDTGDNEGAAESYRDALTHQPDYVDAHNGIGFASAALADLDTASASFRRVVELRPDYPHGHNNLGKILLRMGKVEASIAAQEKAAEIDPNDPEAHVGLGDALVASGNLDGAAASYLRAIEADPAMAVAYRHLAEMNSYTFDGGEIEVMETLISAAACSDPQLVDLSFALGQSYVAAGDHDRAFEHLRRGNRLVRQTLSYDVAVEEAAAAHIAAVFDENLLAAKGNAGYESSVPVFIVGMPRSGTTLIEQILASHPRVHGAGESKFLAELARELECAPGAASGFPDAVRELSEADMIRLGRRYVENIRPSAPDARRITDKMPSNFLRIGFAHLLLPDARFVHCVRDPRDTCFACYMRLFDHGQPFAYDLEDLGRYHRLYDRLMEHWRRVLPLGAILEVSYENVVADQERETRRILDFMGLPWDDARLSFDRTQRNVVTGSASQVRQPIYRGAVQRWKKFESHLGPLLEILEPVAAGRPAVPAG